MGLFEAQSTDIMFLQRKHAHTQTRRSVRRRWPARGWKAHAVCSCDRRAFIDPLINRGGLPNTGGGSIAVLGESDL